MAFKCPDRQRKAQRDSKARDPEIYAFERTLTSRETGESYFVVKVGKTGLWRHRSQRYANPRCQPKRWACTLPVEANVVHVPVPGMAEAEVAEALAKMVIERHLKFPSPCGMKEHYLHLSINEAEEILREAARRATLWVGDYIREEL